MGFLSVSLTFVGYVLVYASVAKGGRFATSPWAGVYMDAYEGETSPAAPKEAPPAGPQPKPRGIPQPQQPIH